MNEGMFTSDRQDWETPQRFFDKLDEVYRFTLDVCATTKNTKCPKFFTPEVDGLAQDWSGETWWCNPPYGREIGRWMEKCYLETKGGDSIGMALIPVRTDTKWWHDWVMRAYSIGFIRGRLKFVGGSSSAPFPSAIVFWGKHNLLEPRIFSMER